MAGPCFVLIVVGKSVTPPHFSVKPHDGSAPEAVTVTHPSTSPARSRTRRLFTVLLAAAFAWPLAPLPPGLGMTQAEAAQARKSVKKSAKHRFKQRREATRPPVRVERREAGRQGSSRTTRRLGSGSSPPPYGSVVLPRPTEPEFGPGTIRTPTNQLRVPGQYGYEPRGPRSRSFAIPAEPGHGPGTYVTPIYPGTVGP